VERASGQREKATFEIDVSSDPMAFDLTPFDPEGTRLDPLLGIVQIEKDKVTICVPRPKAARPKEFTSTMENKCQLLVLEREKP
jgi:uncharacterized protein (TIGR03067 family)